MKSLTLVLFASFASSVLAAPYIVGPMICRGRLLPTSGAHESYTVLLQKFESFRSTRRDGTLANSLEVSNTYGNPGEVINERTAQGDEVWQMAPLRVTGNKVTHPSFVGELDLRIVSTRTVNGKRTDTLRGTWLQSGSVVRGHGYNLSCTAKVVAVPTRTDDCREGCR